MSKVFFSVTMSLDGFLAPESSYDDVGDKRFFAQWFELQAWALQQKFLRENLKLGTGGETGESNQLLEETFARTGATIMGKRMFDGGERGWPEDAPFHTPVFVLTRQVRAPWERKGGTTFHFENNGIHAALAKAREVVAASGKDIRIGGGANVIRAFLNAGLVDRFHIALSPVFLGRGTPLFDRMEHDKLKLNVTRTVHTPAVTHLFYDVSQRQKSNS